MYVKSEALILSVNKHRDNSMIIQVFSSEYGRASFMVYGAYANRNKKTFASVLHPFSLVEIDADIKPNRDLHVIKDIKALIPMNGILFDPMKSTIALFLSEVFLSSLKALDADKTLFLFLKESVLVLDRMERGIANFHIAFLLNLTNFLGVYPNLSEETTSGYFDMRQAEFSLYRPYHSQYIDSVHCKALQLFSRMNYRNLHLFRFSQNERREASDRIIEYYKIHLHGFGEIISLSVLKSVFEE